MTKKTVKKGLISIITAAVAVTMSISASATADSSSTTSSSGGIQQYFSFILLGGMLVLMYFLMIRPQKKKEKEAKEMRDSLKPGDKIVTIGGIMGRVCAVKDDSVTIETGADKVRIKFLKSAIANVERSKAVEGKTEKKEGDSEKKSEEKPE